MIGDSSDSSSGHSSSFSNMIESISENDDFMSDFDKSELEAKPIYTKKKTRNDYEQSDSLEDEPGADHLKLPGPLRKGS